MSASEILYAKFEQETGQKRSTNQIEHHDWYIKYVEWLESKFIASFNFIVKETTFYDSSPEIKIVNLIGSPIDAFGSELFYDFLDDQAMEKAFVFSKDCAEYVKARYQEGTFQYEDTAYRKYTLILEHIKTDREETKHTANNWSMKQETVRKWTKNGFTVKEII